MLPGESASSAPYQNTHPSRNFPCRPCTDLEVTDTHVHAIGPRTQSILETVWPDFKPDFLKAQSVMSKIYAGSGHIVGLMN